MLWTNLVCPVGCPPFTSPQGRPSGVMDTTRLLSCRFKHRRMSRFVHGEGLLPLDGPD
jgi:hypothetical protein